MTIAREDGRERPDGTLPPPTAEVRRLVQIVGPQAALKLIEARGGTRVYIPKHPVDWLVRLLGEAGAAALAQAWGGESPKLPFGRAWRVLVYHARGESYAKIARHAGCTEDTVWRILSRHDRTTKQLDMFEREAS